MQTSQQNQVDLVNGQMAGARLGDVPGPSKAGGPPSLRPKRSQRFTVAANTNSNPSVAPVSVPTLQAPSLDRGLSNTSLSVSSVSDETEPYSSPSTPIYTSYSSSTALTSTVSAPVQPFQNQSYHMTIPSTAVPYTTPSSVKGRGNNAASHNGNARPGIPIQWVDPGVPQQAGNFAPYLQPFPSISAEDDEVIPNAIVIKNIPFSVRREQLLAIIDDLMIPPPYAFNYHFDNGIFRGLAFANFRLPSEADAAVAGLNGFDLSGRKLRVEYKKVLQAGEKERIEKEKAIKRMRSMQLQKEENLGVMGLGNTTYARSREATFPGEEDFGEVTNSTNSGSRTSTLIPLNSMNFSGGAASSLHSVPSFPTSGEYTPTLSMLGGEKSVKDLDMNDPQTLEIYSRVLLFKDDPMRDELSFARSLAARQRRVVHQVAKKLGLEHKSEGFGDDRHVVVMKGSGTGIGTGNGTERGSRSRQSTLGRSTGNAHALLSRDPYGSSFGAGSGGGLRVKKSMPDMRSSGSHHHSQTLGVSSAAGGERNIHARRSNINLREGFTSSSGRRASSGNNPSPHRSDVNTQTVFGNFSGSFGQATSAPPPPVPALPASVAGAATGAGAVAVATTAVADERSVVPALSSATVGSIVRQPRGPDSGKGFNETWQQYKPTIKTTAASANVNFMASSAVYDTPEDSF